MSADTAELIAQAREWLALMADDAPPQSTTRKRATTILAALEAAEAENARLREALTQIADGWTHRTPGVNPDGSVSTSSMAEALARAALADGGGDG